ncbi:MAG: hypothetical protein PHF84_02085 [bacterium]|nr:hypothetical protein [bacterium]
MVKRLVFSLFLIFLLSYTTVEAGPVLPRVAAFSNTTRAVSPTQINWYSQRGSVSNAPAAIMQYRYDGIQPQAWSTERSNIVTSLSVNTKYFLQVQWRSNTSATRTNQWSTNYLNYRYTLLSSPMDSDLAVYPVSDTVIRMAGVPPAHSLSNLTGCRFTNISGKAQGGSDSPSLTNIYVFTNKGLQANSKYGYRIRYMNGDGIRTSLNPAEITNYTLCRLPNAPSLTTLATNSLNVVINSNSNPSRTRYAIRFVSVSGTWYVQRDKTLAAAPVFYTNRNSWGTVNVTGLSRNTSYTVSVSAQNIMNSNTGFGPSSFLYTSPFVPSRPGLSAAGPSSLNVVINDSVNPVTVQHAIRFRYGASTSYVQNDKSLNTAPVYNTISAWGTINVTGLSYNTCYTVSVNSLSLDSEYTTVYSIRSNLYTAATNPGLPSVTANYHLSSNYFAKAFFSANGNPSYTTFAILCTNNNEYLQGDGTSAPSAVWNSESWWESSFRNYHINLNANTYYGYRVYARNQNGLGSQPSAAGRDLTPPAPPGTINVTEMNNDYFQINWNSASGASDYRIYYHTNSSASLSAYIPLGINTLTSFTDERNGKYPVAVTGVRVTNTSATDTSELRAQWNTGTTPLPSTNYFYRIRSRKADGKEGAFSLIAAGVSNITPVIVSYRIFRETVLSNNCITTVYTDSGLSANTRYNYQVRALSSDGLGGPKSITASNYTAIETPAGILFNTINSNLMNVSATGTLSSIARKFSGLFFNNYTNGTPSGWRQVNSWDSISLDPNKQYGFTVKARNAEGLETPECGISNRYTLCRIPLSPIVGTNFTNAMMVLIRSNKNPAYTRYAISNIVTNEFIQTDGSLGLSPVWQTYAQWQGASGGITNTGLSGSINYAYSVKAVNQENVQTVASPVSLWKYTLARVPSNLRSPSHTTTNISLFWHNKGASYFSVECALDADGVPGTFIYLKKYSDLFSATNYIHTGLWPNSKYWYRVSGYNGNGLRTILSTNIYVITVQGAPESPTNLTGTPSRTNAVLWQWTDRSFSENYFIVRNTNGALIPNGILPVNTVSFLETNLKPNTICKRFLFATNEYGRSPYSATNMSCTYASLVQEISITLLSETYTESSLKIAWTGNNISSYGIERSLVVNNTPVGWELLASSFADPCYIDPAVIQSNTYQYRVTSYNRLSTANPGKALSLPFFVRKNERPRTEFIKDNYISPDETRLDIMFDTLSSGLISIKIYNLNGRLVRTIVDAEMAPGRHIYQWLLDNDEKRPVSRGFYFIHIRGPDGLNQIKKVILAR